MKVLDCLDVSAVRGKLSYIREHIREAAQRCGIGPDAGKLFPLETAVSEFCENVMRHGYRNNNGRLLILTAVDGARVAVTIIDKANPFDITKYSRLFRKRKGLAFDYEKVGLRMIIRTCDEIVYRRKRDLNETELIKYIF